MNIDTTSPLLILTVGNMAQQVNKNSSTMSSHHFSLGSMRAILSPLTVPLHRLLSTFTVHSTLLFLPFPPRLYHYLCGWVLLQKDLPSTATSTCPFPILLSPPSSFCYCHASVAPFTSLYTSWTYAYAHTHKDIFLLGVLWLQKGDLFPRKRTLIQKGFPQSVVLSRPLGVRGCFRKKKKNNSEVTLCVLHRIRE